MAEKVSIICPECAKEFQAPPEVVGRKIRCKNCGKAFVAAKAKEIIPTKKKPEKPAETPAGIIPFKDDDDDGDGKPYEVTSLDLAPRCPSCANELESEEDKVCLHCGFNLETRTKAETRRIKDVTGGDVFMWLLPGILAAVGFFICFTSVTWDIIYRIFFFTWPVDWEQLEKNIYNCCDLWFNLLLVFLMYMSGKFSIKRLIFNNKPPEVEI